MRYILGFLIFTYTFSYGQDTKFILKKGKGYNEEYYVLSNDTIRHGTYIKYRNEINSGITIIESGNYENGRKAGKWEFYYDILGSPLKKYDKSNSLRETGHFVNGMKNGLWITYHLDTIANNVSSQKSEISKKSQTLTLQVEQRDLRPMLVGQFLNDKRVGEWISFDFAGRVYQKYNFSKSTLLKDLSLQDTLNYNYNRGALFLGGEPHLISKLDNNFNQTGIFKTISNDSSTVVISIYIKKDGLISNPQIIASNGTSKMEKESLRAVESLKEWLPAVQNGEPITSEYTIAITIISKTIGRVIRTHMIKFESLTTK